MASQITQLPTPPQRTDDQQTFTTRANALMAALQTFVTETNTVATEAEADATTASSAAGTATTQAANAADSATTAQNAANTAVNAPGTQATSTSSITIGTGSKSFTLAETGKAFVVNQFVSITNSGTNWMTGNITAFNSGTGAITVNVINSSGTGSFTSWTIVPATPVSVIPDNITRSARTSNTILGVSDKGTWIDVTSGTFTQTFTAAATLGNGWWCWYGNSSTGEITLDPNGAETIDTKTSFKVYPGEIRLIQCDGTSLFSIVVKSYYLTSDVSGTWTKPPGYKAHSGIVRSGGGSGQKRGATGLTSEGGWGGGAFPFTYPDAALNDTEAFTVGAGGAAVSSATIGNIGGSSSFKGITVAGGSAGDEGNATSRGGSVTVGGAALVNTGGTLAVGFESTQSSNNTVWGGAGSSVSSGTQAAHSVQGGGGGGSVRSDNVAQTGGTSVFGGNGGNGSSTGSGVDGTAPGGGGGATQTGAQSGAGASGRFEIWGEV